MSIPHKHSDKTDVSLKIGRYTLPFENVEIYYFQNMEEIISDLTLYMDLIHYHPDVNKTLVDLIGANEYKVTLENKDQVLENMKIMANKCITEYAEEYFKEYFGVTIV